jgi:hypothetical protein
MRLQLVDRLWNLGFRTLFLIYLRAWGFLISAKQLLPLLTHSHLIYATFSFSDSPWCIYTKLMITKYSNISKRLFAIYHYLCSYTLTLTWHFMTPRHNLVIVCEYPFVGKSLCHKRAHGTCCLCFVHQTLTPTHNPSLLRPPGRKRMREKRRMRDESPKIATHTCRENRQNNVGFFDFWFLLASTTSNHNFTFFW